MQPIGLHLPTFSNHNFTKCHGNEQEGDTYIMLMYVLTLTCHFFVFCALTPHDTVCGTLFVLCVSMWPYLSEVDVTGFPAVERCVHNTQSGMLSSRCTFNILSQL